MESRMSQPAVLLPDAMAALQALHKAVHRAGLPDTIALLVDLRASQLNGCGVCVDMHARDLRKKGESDERLFGVAAWREMPYFTDPERAALALTEAVTLLHDPLDPVPDDIWDDAVKQFDEPVLAALLIQIGAINVWNRLNVATKQVVGAWTG